MHRTNYILFFTLSLNLSFAQNKVFETYLTDTSKVSKYPNWINKTKFEDTITKEYIYSVKSKYASYEDDWIIYLDSTKKKNGRNAYQG